MVSFAETSRNGLESVLERIEKERFSSLNDPGIHGILTRINRLEFVKTSFAACSGHPAYRTDGKTVAEDGYIYLAYNPYNKKSAEFHNKLRDIYIEKGGYAVYFAGRGFVSDEVTTAIGKLSRPPKYQDLDKTGFDFTDAVGGALEIKVGSSRKYDDPEDIAVALSAFWQRVSDLIGEYEPTLVKKVLKPYYFGLRSNYGKIEAAHPAFDKYVPNGHLQKSEAKNSIENKIKSALNEKRENSKKTSLAKVLAALALAYIGGAAFGFGAGTLYFS